MRDERLYVIHPSALILPPLSVACCLAVALASLRHTGSLAFPIDDGYIYSNYVLSAAQGSFFSYNAGETSGGITGFAWYVLCTLAYWLLTPFHSILEGLAPPLVRGDVELSRQAAHLYLSAYLAGAICHALTALGAYRLAHAALPDVPGKAGWRTATCWLVGAATAADLGLVWGAMSGLEVPLAAALGVWAVAVLITEVGVGRLRWSLLLAALLPLARPEMLVVALSGALWLSLRALATWRAGGTLGRELRYLGAYLLATGAGVAVMSLVYFAGWGRPLPSSFYAKVGGLRLGPRFFSAAQELVIAGRALPFVAAGAGLLGGLLGLLRPGPQTGAGPRNLQPARWATLLVLLVASAYVVAIMLSLPWFGQEDRYLLPVHPFFVVLLGMLGWIVLARWLPAERESLRVYAKPTLTIATLALCALPVAGNYLWATRNYAVQVRNIADAHIVPAIWLRQNSAPDSLIASEPIGAVRLFSGRRTVDLVGLTSPATLGTYGDWSRAWPRLQEIGADYLLFYPRWFDNSQPPPWALTEQTFSIPDNKIAGDSLIAIYRLDWSE